MGISESCEASPLPFLTMLSPSRWTVALLSWLALFPVTLGISAWATCRIADTWTQGVVYYRSQHPAEEAGWAALMVAALASMLFICILPFRLQDALQKVNRWRVVGIVMSGQMLIHMASSLVALGLTFHEGIPSHVLVPSPVPSVGVRP